MRCLLNTNGLLVSGRRCLPLAVAGPGSYRPVPPGEVGLGGTLMVTLLKKRQSLATHNSWSHFSNVPRPRHQRRVRLFLLGGYESFNCCRLILSQTAVFELIMFVSPKANYSELESFDSSLLPPASRKGPYEQYGDVFSFYPPRFMDSNESSTMIGFHRVRK